MKWFSKSVFNFLLEGVSLIVLMGLLATGLAMKFTLPPRSGERLVQWGLSRHEWGDVHFWFAMAFIALIVLHLVLHWRWIWLMACGQNPKLGRVRGIAFVILTAILLAIAALPWLVPVQSQPGGGRGRQDGFRGRGYHGGRVENPAVNEAR